MKTGIPAAQVASEAQSSFALQAQPGAERSMVSWASEALQQTPRQLTQRRLIDSLINGTAPSSQAPSQAAQLQPMATASPIAAPKQMKKDEAERGEKHRRVQQAQETIGALGNNVNAGLHGHIFNGLPVAGGALNPANPTGLHAYTNGALPAGITQVAVHGSTGRIHTLTWRATAGAVTKDSTMFPVWMPAAHVNTLMAMKYAGIRQNAVAPALIHPDATRTYIEHGQPIYDRIVQVGGTVYPQ